MTQYQRQPVEWHKGQGESHPDNSFEGSSKKGRGAVQGPLSIVGHFSKERLNLTFLRHNISHLWLKIAINWPIFSHFWPIFAVFLLY